jgi:hypothetical protein
MANISMLLSFKENEKWLYDEICKHSNKSGFIKDILILYFKKEEVKTTKKMEIDILDL